MSSLAGKRKKKVPINPNPLFTMWLKEWRDEAANKGIKTQYSYNKVTIKNIFSYYRSLISLHPGPQLFW